MSALNNLALTVWALTGCTSKDEEILSTEATDPLEGVEPNPDFKIPEPTIEGKTQSEYLDTILCGNDGQGLFGNTKANDIFHLKGTLGHFTSNEQLIKYQVHIVRRETEQADQLWYEVGDWLADDWQIIEISKLRAVVLNQCGYEEVLVPDDSSSGSHQDSKVEQEEVVSEQTEEEKVASGDFGFVIDEIPTPDGSKLDVYEDNTIEFNSLNTSEGVEYKVTAIYRYDEENDSYKMYHPNGSFSGQEFDREFLQDYLSVEITPQ